ncbi:MAG TPA: Gfo/Idh/MocA family oxidoreductase [Armatimonadetes bacterium]|nr:Gfo/Idh/MocA family oxidoreductase [Armatimonadota bacterium]
MKELNLGFVGAGANARAHMKSVAALEAVRVAAVYDVDAERAQAAAQEYGAKAYPDLRAMLDTEPLDALYISIPPFAHGEPEKLAAEHRLDVYIEKPVALSLEQGLEICAALEEAGVITCVGYQLRYFPATQQAKVYLADKTIAMVVHHRWGGYSGQPWWRVMEQSGGQLVEQTTHGVDLMRYLAGEIVEVYAKYARRVMHEVPNFTIPDSQMVLVEFASGALGCISTGCFSTGGGAGGMLTFLLRDRRVEWQAQGLQLFPPDPTLEELEVPRYPSADEVFIEAVRNRDPARILSPYRDALKTLEVTLAANESARTGRPVATTCVRGDKGESCLGGCSVA